jgi:hypothetical protein
MGQFSSMSVRVSYNEDAPREETRVSVATTQLMSDLSSSITIGEFVYEGLFISPVLWNGVSILTNIDLKLSAFTDFCDGLANLEHLQLIDPNLSNLNEFDLVISSFEKIIAVHKPLLVKKLKGYSEDVHGNGISLPYSNPDLLSPSAKSNLEISSPTKSISSPFTKMASLEVTNSNKSPASTYAKMSNILKKSFKGKLKITDLETTNHFYRQTLSTFLKKSANVFGIWLKLTRSHNRNSIHIKNKLGNIMRFYHQVILVTVLNDFAMLLNRFSRKLLKK